MNEEPPDDLTLARRAGDGDEAALEALYERYADLVFAFIRHRVQGSTLDTEAVWQETLVAAVRSLPQYRGQSRFFTWLCGIARRKIATHFRCLKQNSSHCPGTSDADVAKLMAISPLPEELVSRQETRLQVVESLGMLSVEYRTALVGRYADGQSVEAVAKLLGKTYKATESLLSRARTSFREAFCKLNGQDDE